MKKLFITLSLLSLVSVANASVDVNLKYGMRGSEVSELQEFLIDKGFITGNSTGFFGLLTLKGVKAYQTSVSLPSTGFVGAMTRAKVNEELLAVVDESTRAEFEETGTTTPIVAKVAYDVCPNIEGVQSVVPTGMFMDSVKGCFVPEVQATPVAQTPAAPVTQTPAPVAVPFVSKKRMVATCSLRSTMIKGKIACYMDIHLFDDYGIPVYGVEVNYSYVDNGKTISVYNYDAIVDPDTAERTYTGSGKDFGNNLSIDLFFSSTGTKIVTVDVPSMGMKKDVIVDLN